MKTNFQDVVLQRYVPYFIGLNWEAPLSLNSTPVDILVVEVHFAAR